MVGEEYGDNQGDREEEAPGAENFAMLLTFPSPCGDYTMRCPAKLDEEKGDTEEIKNLKLESTKSETNSKIELKMSETSLDHIYAKISAISISPLELSHFIAVNTLATIRNGRLCP